MQAQDFATHGMWTEPNTGIRFYTSSQTNSATPGQLLDGTSKGGFIEGVALPPNAATVDATEFIGLIVSQYYQVACTQLTTSRLEPHRMDQLKVGLVYFKELKMLKASCGLV